MLKYIQVQAEQYRPWSLGKKRSILFVRTTPTSVLCGRGIMEKQKK